MSWRLVIAALALMAAGVAQGASLTQQVHLKWVPPTTRIDGTPLALDELDRYVLRCGQAPGEYNDVRQVIHGAERTELKVQASVLFDQPGPYYCTLTVIDVDGFESPPSNEQEIALYVEPSAPDMDVSVTIEIQ